MNEKTNFHCIRLVVIWPRLIPWFLLPLSRLGIARTSSASPLAAPSVRASAMKK